MASQQCLCLLGAGSLTSGRAELLHGTVSFHTRRRGHPEVTCSRSCLCAATGWPHQGCDLVLCKEYHWHVTCYCPCVNARPRGTRAPRCPSPAHVLRRARVVCLSSEHLATGLSTRTRASHASRLPARQRAPDAPLVPRALPRAPARLASPSSARAQHGAPPGPRVRAPARGCDGGGGRGSERCKTELWGWPCRGEGCVGLRRRRQRLGGRGGRPRFPTWRRDGAGEAGGRRECRRQHPRLAALHSSLGKWPG